MQEDSRNTGKHAIAIERAELGECADVDRSGSGSTASFPDDSENFHQSCDRLAEWISRHFRLVLLISVVLIAAGHVGYARHRPLWNDA